MSGTKLRNARGQTVLELIFVLPIVLFVLLAFVQISEIVLANLTTRWAARQAARVLAVHVSDPENAEAKVRMTALRILAPLLPPIVNAGNDSGVPSNVKWALRAAAYDQLGGVGRDLFALGSPMTATMSIESNGVIVDNLVSAQKTLSTAPNASATAIVTLRFNYRLRVPLVARVFADGFGSPPFREFVVSEAFPVMYAPAEQGGS